MLMLMLTLTCDLRVAILGGRIVCETTTALGGFDMRTSHVSTTIRKLSDMYLL
jgi:hypothetical protein